MRRSIVCLTGLVLATCQAAADESSKAEKVRRLVAAQGLEHTFAQELEASRVQAERAARDVLREIRRQLVVDQQVEARLEAAFIGFNQRLAAPLSVADIAEVWAGLYGSRFTEAEIDVLLEFYSSELGQKEVLASRQALEEFAVYFQQQGARILRPALDEYIEQLETIVRECDCRRTAAIPRR